MEYCVLMNRADRYHGQRLTATLAAQGRKGRWLANEVGVSESLISKIAKGDRFPDAILAERISKVLGVPFGMLFELQVRSEEFSRSEQAA